MMITGWYHPNPEEELARVKLRIAELEAYFKDAPSIDDHSQDEIWHLALKRDRLIRQIHDDS